MPTPFIPIPSGPRSKWPLVVAWCTVAVLVTVAVLRLVVFDAAYPLIWINSFTFYLYLPAYLCLVWAVCHRRWLLAAASMVLIGFHLFLVVPDFLPAAPAESPGDARPQKSEAAELRLYYANVHASNRHTGALFQEIAEAQADIVVLVEFVDHWPQAAENSPVMADFPHRVVASAPGCDTLAVYARHPLRHVPAQGFLKKYVLPVECTVGDRRLGLVGLHAPRPMRWKWSRYLQYWQELQDYLYRQTPPLVVVGDFNTTQYSRTLQELTSPSLRSAHRAAGRGYAATWPNFPIWVPSIRIDHALLSPRVECLHIAEGENPGSDHRSLALDLRLH